VRSRIERYVDDSNGMIRKLGRQAMKKLPE